MILYFEDSNGQFKVIDTIDEKSISTEELLDAIYKKITDFLDKHNFKSYYTRQWNENIEGNLMTTFDVGSHTEFFHCCPAIEKLNIESG